jgi:hypothetical protein
MPKFDLSSDEQQLHDNNPQKSVVEHNDFKSPICKGETFAEMHADIDNVKQSQAEHQICMGPLEKNPLQNK